MPRDIHQEPQESEEHDDEYNYLEARHTPSLANPKAFSDPQASLNAVLVATMASSTAARSGPSRTRVGTWGAPSAGSDGQHPDRSAPRDACPGAHPQPELQGQGSYTARLSISSTNRSYQSPAASAGCSSIHSPHGMPSCNDPR